MCHPNDQAEQVLFMPWCAAGLELLLLLRPGRSDVGKNIPYLAIAQRLIKGGHSAFETRYTSGLQSSGSSELGVFKKQIIVVMPGVTRSVMRRCRKDAISVGGSPIWLPFQVHTVA